MKQVFLLVILTAIWEASSVVANTNNTRGKEDGLINPVTPRSFVRVTNLLNEGLPFTIHCKSRDDDLGAHDVSNKGTYQWSFHRNIFGTTLFFCGIHWRDGSMVYDVYKASRDIDRCFTNCYWEVTNNALIGYTQKPFKQDIQVPWQKPKN
ncbi:hypothetical protein VNO77_06815 [Canavalia gladiata]|uniref:S-protein homolog n=1 Tax=Canavalia gladiata TaxID=3824 RepID=A0AAN9R087_CANGL